MEPGTRGVTRSIEQRRRLPITAAFGAMWLVTLVPLWLPRMLPLLDLPNHIDAIAIWHRYSDPSWGYSRFYRLNLLPLPYWGYFFPVHMLSFALPLEVANKVYLSVYALALPVGAARLARQMDRSSWLGLLTFPLVFNLNFQYGFITFCAGTTLMLYALVTLDCFLQAPTRRGAIALLLMTTFLYTTHVLPWLFFGVAAAILLLCHPLRTRTLVAAALMMPSVILGAWTFHAAKDGSTDVKPGPLAYAAKLEPIVSQLREVPRRVFATWRAFDAFVVLGALVLVVVLLVITNPADEAPRSRFRYRLELLVILAVVATFALPAHLLKPVDLWMIGGRFVFVTALLAALLPRGEIVGPRGVLLGIGAALHVYYCARLSAAWVRFDRRAASVRRLCEGLPRGSSTLTLMLGDGEDPDVEAQAVPYTQFHAYPQLYGGGFDPWALDTGFPMVKKPGAVLPSPRWKMPSTFRFSTHGVYYDYILTKGEAGDYALLAPGNRAAAPLIGHDGEWRLYHVLAKREPPTTANPKSVP